MNFGSESDALRDIQALNDAFCYELDRGTPEGFAALFTDDARYTHGTRQSRGRAEVLAFARSRTSAGPRTSRHIQSGLRVTLQGATKATGISCCTTFAASADPPIATTLPTLIADFHDVYLLLEDGWRFAERHIVPIFVPDTKTQ